MAATKSGSPLYHHHLLLLLLLLLQAVLLPSPCTADQLITAPAKLRSGEYISFHRYKFMLDGCQFVVYDGGEAVWSTNTTVVPSGECTAILKEDGSLRVYDSWFNQVWTNNIESSPGYYYLLALLPHGEVVIYDNPLWSTGTYFGSNFYASSPQVLIYPSKLQPGESLSVGNYRFLVEKDCRVSLFDQAIRIWSSGTNNNGAVDCYASMDGDGQLRLYDTSNNKIWESTTSAVTPPSTTLLVQPSRQVIIWSGPIWSTSPRPTEGTKFHIREVVTNEEG